MIVKGKLLMDQDGDSVAMADPGPIPSLKTITTHSTLLKIV